WDSMEQPMESPDTVLEEIRQLSARAGEDLNKKHIKKHYPELLRRALYYFPSWEHAIQKSKD
ncbi:MAG: hypothetical protein OWR62_15730, partial [Sulfobacillus thermotolerans]|nr:hypothetical protein [Sulfobacillus thermotolerans]